MRNELEIIATIERYLDGTLSAAERTVFEEELNTDPALKEALQLQRAILEGVERAHWKEQIHKARSRYWRHRFLKGGALGLGFVIIAAVTIWALHSSPEKPATTRFPTEKTAAAASAASSTGTADSGAVGQGAAGPGVASQAATGLPVMPVKDTHAPVAAPAPTDADKALPAENFRIDATRDTVLETQGGILLSIPAGSFRQGDGMITTGSIDL
jgi:anti-sigma factor RsiW